MRAEQAVLDVLPGHPLARHIDDFLTGLANTNRPRNTIRAYRGDVVAFAIALKNKGTPVPLIAGSWSSRPAGTPASTPPSPRSTGPSPKPKTPQPRSRIRSGADGLTRRPPARSRGC